MNTETTEQSPKQSNKLRRSIDIAGRRSIKLKTNSSVSTFKSIKLPAIDNDEENHSKKLAFLNKFKTGKDRYNYFITSTKFVMKS